ncbi:MAG: hypothetical protein AAFX93_20215 [Verrucomicrobiota bacterium]
MNYLAQTVEVVINVPIEEQLTWWGQGAGVALGMVVIIVAIRIFRKLGSESMGLSD